MCCEAGLLEAQMQLMNKWVISTEAPTGIGRTAAERFAAKGKASRFYGAVVAADGSYWAERLGEPEC